MIGTPSWVQVVDATEICKGCGKPLGAGRAVRVKNPPASMTQDERDSLFHRGQCVSDWAKEEERAAIERVLVYPGNIVTRQRGAEMGQLAKSARDWVDSESIESASGARAPRKSSIKKVRD